VSSYSRGINGIAIDLTGTHAGLSANDFVFKTGNNNSPNGWALAPAPTAVSVRSGAGAGGADRIEITWASGAIENTWLEVTVLPTTHTLLADPDVFYWGSKVGDIGDPTPTSFTTTSSGDATPIVAGGLGAAGGITNVRDIDRSNTITSSGDRSIALANLGGIVRINIAAGGPSAPEGTGAENQSAVADGGGETKPVTVTSTVSAVSSEAPVAAIARGDGPASAAVDAVLLATSAPVNVGPVIAAAGRPFAVPRFVLPQLSVHSADSSQPLSILPSLDTSDHAGQSIWRALAIQPREDGDARTPSAISTGADDALVALGDELVELLARDHRRRSGRRAL
jgi:hypothetical protein